MRNILKYVATGLAISAIAAGCGTQVVDFPEDINTSVGGSGGSGGNSDVTTTSTTLASSVASSSVSTTSATSSSSGGDPCDGVCCPEGQVCVDGECVTPDPCDGVCCPEGQECVDGECVTPDPCDGIQCCEGEECVDGQCVPKDPCGGQCSEGEDCVYGHCVCNGDDEPSGGCSGNKTLLCHHAAWHKHNICVSNAAVSAHLAHGDTLGDCSYCF